MRSTSGRRGFGTYRCEEIGGFVGFLDNVLLQQHTELTSERVNFHVREPVRLLFTACTRLSRNAHIAVFVLLIQAAYDVRQPGYLVRAFVE